MFCSDLLSTPKFILGCLRLEREINQTVSRNACSRITRDLVGGSGKGPRLFYFCLHSNEAFIKLMEFLLEETRVSIGEDYFDVRSE